MRPSFASYDPRSSFLGSPGTQPIGHPHSGVNPFMQQLPMGTQTCVGLAQGPFAFHSGSAGQAPPPPHGPRQVPLPPPPAPVFAHGAHANEPPWGAGPLQPVPSQPHDIDRPAYRSKTCERAFLFVDAFRTGHINASQTKTGLTIVFEQLGDLPTPKDEWFAKVFRNFDCQNSGLLNFRNFQDIAVQWDEHHLAKREARRERERAAHCGGQAESGQGTWVAAQAANSGLPQPPPSQGTGATGVGANQRQNKCPSGHPLVEFQTPFPNFICDICKSGQPRGVPMSGCDLCNFHICTHCIGSYVQAAGVAAPLPPSAGAVPSAPSTGELSICRFSQRTSTGSTMSSEDSPTTPRGGTGAGRVAEQEKPENATSPQTSLMPAAAPAPGGSRAADQSKNSYVSFPTGRPDHRVRAAAAEIVPEVMFPTYVGRLQIFDDYEFKGDIGVGSFGKVMVVRHRGTRQLRACKVVAVQTALQKELMDNEIQLLKSMNHPNIMKLYEVYTENAGEGGAVANGNIYLVTELCEGGDLFSRIIYHYQKLKQPMTEGHVAYMLRQILSAVAYCHGLDIVHRDIKPENILFVDRSPEAAIKVIDFGLANSTGKIRDAAKEVKVPRSGTLGRIARALPAVGGRHIIPWNERKRVMQRAGTVHYMAPEMLDGDYDQKADVFSVGIILCQLLTGWHPFYVPQVDDEQSVRQKILDPEPVEFPEWAFRGVSRDGCNLCRGLLEKDPRRRIAAEEALKHPWLKDPTKPSPFGNVDGLSVSIFEGLMQYQAYNKLKRAVLQLLTQELSEYQIQELRKKFMALDKQGDGLLSPEELVEGMRHVGYNMSEEELDRVMAALDVTGGRRIGYKEFISALIQRRVKFDRQHLLECFRKFDTNNTGVIDYEDVRNVLHGGGPGGAAPGITMSEWQEIALPPGTKTGTDGKLQLTFDEFVALMEAPDP